MRAPALPAWVDSLVRGFALGTLTSALAIPAALMAWVRSPLARGVGEPAEQPIQFDHRHHVGDDGIDCLYCHVDATRSPYAGVPSTELCMGCHSQILTQSPLLAPIRASAAQGTPIRWRRVDEIGDFAFFDHSAHVTRNVGCETCHGRVDRMAVVYRAVPFTMGFCLDCHRDPDPHLRDQSLITTFGLPLDRTRGRRIHEERDIHAPTHCSGCHR